MSPQYGDREYWDERYTKETQNLDWYQNYFALRPIIRQYVPLTASVLQVGVGTSRIQVDMVEDGYQKVVNTDYSPIVVDFIRRQHKGIEGLTYEVSDCRDMPEFVDGSFDAVLDKGTLDAILCGTKSYESSAQMLSEIHRVVQGGGVFVEVTYGAPDTRLVHLQAAGEWRVVVFSMTKPDLTPKLHDEGSTSQQMHIFGPYQPDNEEDMSHLCSISNHHFIYVCTKPNDDAQ